MRFNRVFLLLLLALFSISSVLASWQASITSNKNSYSSGETMLLEISLNEQPVREISSSDISISQGSIAPILVKDTSTHYYSYFNLPVLEDGQYESRLKLMYKINNILQELTFAESFSMDNIQESISISPSVVRVDATKIQDYQVFLKNNNKDIIEVSLSESLGYAELSKSKFQIEKNVQKSFFITIDKTRITSNETGYVSLSYGSSSIALPILVYNFKAKSSVQDLQPQEEPLPDEPGPTQSTAQQTQQQATLQQQKNTTTQSTNITQQASPAKNITLTNPLSFISIRNTTENTINQLFLRLDTDDSLSGTMSLKNKAAIELTNITFTLYGNIQSIVRLNETYFGYVPANGYISQYIFINELKKPNSSFYQGNLFANDSMGNYASLPIAIRVDDKSSIIQRSKRNVNRILNMDDEKKYIESKDILNFTSSKYDKPKVNKPKRGSWPILVFLLITALLAYIFYRSMKRKKPRKFDDYITSLYKK